MLYAASTTTGCCSPVARSNWAQHRQAGWPYDLVLRLREDAVLDRPITGVLPQVKEGGLVTSACATWHGVNDKGAVVHRTVAESYFTGPVPAVLLATAANFERVRCHWPAVSAIAAN